MGAAAILVLVAAAAEVAMAATMGRSRSSTPRRPVTLAWPAVTGGSDFGLHLLHWHGEGLGFGLSGCLTSESRIWQAGMDRKESIHWQNSAP